jgi:hypothetical protein
MTELEREPGRNGYALIHPAPARPSNEAPTSGKEANIASDGTVVRALILLLAACEQARLDLDQSEVVIDGLGEELATLSVRLHDLLGQDRWKLAT